MKIKHIFAVALIVAVAVIWFSPWQAPRALETRHEPVATKARRHDHQGVLSTAQQHPNPFPAPTSEAIDSYGTNPSSTDTGSAASAALFTGKPASNAFTKRNGYDSQALAMPPSRHHAKHPNAFAQNAGSVTEESASGAESPTISAQDLAPQPAAWVDLGSASTLTPEQEHEVQQMAEELTARLSHSGLDPASQDYRRLWNDMVRQSDFTFMQRYGGEAWEAHHIQAYHLAHDQH